MHTVGMKGEYKLSENLSHLVTTRKPARAVIAAMKTLPKRTKMLPIPPTIPNLKGFLRIRKKAALADEQKFLPVKAIWM